MRSVGAVLVGLLVTCLQYPISNASMTECQVRCPNGMVCVRLEDSNFHLCVRPTSVNVSTIGRSQTPRGQEAGLQAEEREENRADCPRPPVPAGPCVYQCRYHSDCRPAQACCSTGCGYTCVSVTPDAVTKPGSCPRASQLNSEPCGSRCEGDGDCLGRHKCCRTRCGRTCQAPCFHWLSHSGTNPWRLSHRCSDGTPSWD